MSVITTPVSTSNIVTHDGQAVVTTAQLAAFYDVAERNIHKNLSTNADRFIEGKHFITLTNGKLKEFKNRLTESKSVVIGPRAKSLTLWTRRGAARHAKMLQSDRAWDVFEALEDSYFAAIPPRALTGHMAAMQAALDGPTQLDRLIAYIDTALADGTMMSGAWLELERVLKVARGLRGATPHDTPRGRRDV